MLPYDSKQMTRQATVRDKKSESTKENISSSLILVQKNKTLWPYDAESDKRRK